MSNENPISKTHYVSARFFIGIVSFMGALVVIVAGGVLLGRAIVAYGAGTLSLTSFPLELLWLGLVFAVAGFLWAITQILRARLDTADATMEILELLKEQTKKPAAEPTIDVESIQIDETDRSESPLSKTR